MKKVMFFLVTVMSLSFPLSAMSETTFNKEGASKDVSGVINQFRASTNVEVIASGDATTYAATSGHLNGDRLFGSSSGDSQLFWSSRTPGSDVTPPTANDSSAFTGEAWKSL